MITTTRIPLAYPLQKGFASYAAGNGSGSARAIAFKTEIARAVALKTASLRAQCALVADYFAGDTLVLRVYKVVFN